MTDTHAATAKALDALQTQQTSLANAPKKKMNMAQIDATANEFEGMFLSQAMSAMWQGVETDGPFGGGSAEETWRGMMINEYGNLFAKSGGIGISSMVKAELLRAQESN